MIGTILVFVVAAAFVLADRKKLGRKLRSRTWAVYLVVLLAGSAMSAAAMQVARSPSPLNAVILTYKPFAEWLFHGLGWKE